MTLHVIQRSNKLSCSLQILCGRAGCTTDQLIVWKLSNVKRATDVLSLIPSYIKYVVMIINEEITKDYEDQMLEFMSTIRKYFDGNLFLQFHYSFHTETPCDKFLSLLEGSRYGFAT